MASHKLKQISGLNMAQLPSYTFGSLNASNLHSPACHMSQNQLHQSYLKGALISLAQSQLHRIFGIKYTHHFIMMLIKTEELNLD